MSHTIKVFSVVLSVFFFASCDVVHTKDYHIHNDLEQEILVKFMVEGEADSAIVAVDSNRLIYSDLYVYGTVGVSDDRDEDKISDISIKLDATEIIINEKFWEYEEQGKYQANYSMSVDSSLIQ